MLQFMAFGFGLAVMFCTLTGAVFWATVLLKLMSGTPYAKLLPGKSKRSPKRQKSLPRKKFDDDMDDETPTMELLSKVGRSRHRQSR